MQFRLTLAAGMLVACTAGLTQAQVVPGDAIQTGTKNGPVVSDNPVQYAPRRIVQKRAWVSIPRTGEYQLTIKFMDQCRARPTGGSDLTSQGGVNLRDIERICERHGLTMISMFEQSPDQLAELQARARRTSGKEQPDLAGMMYVLWPDTMEPEQLELAANELNQSEHVEFVEFLEEIVAHGDAAGVASASQSALMRAMESATSAMLVGDQPPNLTASQLQNHFFQDLDSDGQFDPGLAYWFSVEFIGGMDIQALENTGKFILDNGMAHPSWNTNLNGGRGATVNVGVIEFNANLDHFDLRDVILEPGTTLLPPQLGGFSHWNHGTATLGQIVAKDHGIDGPDRFLKGDGAEVGMIGSAPDAQGWFFPTTTTTGGSRLPSAIASALLAFGYGDVISMSIGFAGAPIVASAPLATLLQLGTDSGILTCMSAGNDCADLGNTEYPLGDAGTIVVGAGFTSFGPAGPCWPPLYGRRPYVRRGFSNWTEDELGTKVHVQAWGQDVATCGYGDLWPPDPNLSNANTWYTSTFGGTSAACPMIAGLAANVQGLAKMFYGAPLGPSDLRNIAIGTQLIQDAQPSTPLILGPCDDQEVGCFANPCDEGCFDPLEDPCQVGGFPQVDDYFDNSASVINDLFNTNPFGNSILTHAQVLTGTMLDGSLSSLRAADGAVMIVRSDFRSYGSVGGTHPFPSPVYFLVGQFTDVGVIAEPNDPEFVTNVSLTAVLADDSFSSTIVGGELYNFGSSRWDWIALYVGSTAFTQYQWDNLAPGRSYVNLNNGRILGRVWVYAPGFGLSNRFHTAYDLISVNVSSVGPGGGGG